VRTLKESKSKGVEVNLTKLRQVFFLDFGIAPSLLDKYIRQLETAGLVKTNNDIIEYIGGPKTADRVP